MYEYLYEEEYDYDPMIPRQEGSGFFSDLASKAASVLTSETTKQLGKKALEKSVEGIATKTGEKAVEAVAKKVSGKERKRKGKRKMEDIEEEDEEDEIGAKPKSKKIDKHKLIQSRMQADIEQALKAERKRKKKKLKSSDEFVEDILSS